MNRPVNSPLNPQRESLEEVEHLFDRLWPLFRSITGAGVRATHDILCELVPLEAVEIPSGTRVLDWEVPKEWIVREAHVTTPDGRRILDIEDDNLHLLNYSVPFRGTLTREDLDRHLFSRPDLPDAVPYLTSYYEPRWGFCIADAQRRELPPGDYQVVVDTEHVDGSMTLSEAILPGEETGEVLVSTYTCHPSMANNELSGPLAAAYLYRRLASWPHRRLTYRFVFLPETIGAIAYLNRNGRHLTESLVAGYVVTCVGLDEPFTYKRSRRGESLADRAALHALTHSGQDHAIVDFSPVGSDERQYCSPGFDLPVGSLMRGAHGAYPAYHTSLDDKSLISFAALQGSIDIYESILRGLDANCCYRNLFPYGEPQLGRRGLYPTLSGADQRSRVEALMWVLNLSDGDNGLLAIAERSGQPIEHLAEAAEAALRNGVLERIAA